MELAGCPIAAGTFSKSARSIVKVGDWAVELTCSRIFVPDGWVEPNIARASSKKWCGLVSPGLLLNGYPP
jgi:hypothetical protein